MELALIMLAAAVVVAAVIFGLSPAKGSGGGTPAPDPRLDTLLAKQGEIGGQFTQTMAAQEALTRALGERLAWRKAHASATMTGQRHQDRAPPSRHASPSANDRAQKNISAICRARSCPCSRVLSNKQARGAFGQAQMEEIVRDGLPHALRFPVHAFNRNRPDCVIRIPGNKALLVIDSKFPLKASEPCAAPPPKRTRKRAGPGARQPSPSMSPTLPKNT